MTPPGTCPRCKMTSHHPDDIRFGWCANCNMFIYAMEPVEPIYFNSIVAHIQKKVRGFIKDSPFSLQLEMFSDERGVMCWRALLKLGNSVWKSSSRAHVSPQDALRELSESMEDRL